MYIDKRYSDRLQFINNNYIYLQLLMILLFLLDEYEIGRYILYFFLSRKTRVSSVVTALGLQ